MNSAGDLIITAGIISFVVSLIPGIIENLRLRKGWTLSSCIGTVAGAYTVTFGLYLVGATTSVAAELAIAVLWTVLAIQSWRWRR